MIVPYSVGFVFSDDGQHVVLLEKNRPAARAGRWIGVGGHVEEGETAHQAMVRECMEECGLDIPQWTHLTTCHRPDGVIDIFAATANVWDARSCTDEVVAVYPLSAPPALLSDITEEVWPQVLAFAAALPKTADTPRRSSHP